MAEDMQHWTPRPTPDAPLLEGQYANLERLDPARHTEALFAAANIPNIAAKFEWLYEYPPQNLAAMQDWTTAAAAGKDPLFYAVIDKQTGQAAGRQAFMRIDEANGAIELGSIYWGPLIARKPAATEALYLAAAYVFDTLGYRRFEWKCNNDNLPSKLAAQRFGFTAEGVFRQHLVVKGKNRDTAWFAMTDKDWPRLKDGYQTWLDPANFDGTGQQKRRLSACFNVS
ncbi:MAG: GNAT family N-acetyltransferase [Rhodobacteraceae bacterium]|nr:GNAT family N-acetyltransferase [Paracoccaceae bacterium]